LRQGTWRAFEIAEPDPRLPRHSGAVRNSVDGFSASHVGEGLANAVVGQMSCGGDWVRDEINPRRRLSSMRFDGTERRLKARRHSFARFDPFAGAIEPFAGPASATISSATGGAFPRELVGWLNRMINSREQARRPLLGHCPNRRARSLQSVEYSGMPLISGVERRQVSRSIKRHLGNVNGLIRSRHCHWGRDQHPSCEDTDRDGERCSDER